MCKMFGMVFGYGEIVSVMVLGIEDIVMFEGVNIFFIINDIKFIDDNMVEYLVVGLIIMIIIQFNVLVVLQVSGEIIEEISYKGRVDLKEEVGNGQYDNSEK